MRRIFSVLAVAALLAAMLVGASVALAQDGEVEECVLLPVTPKGEVADASELPVVSENNVEAFIAKHFGLSIAAFEERYGELEEAQCPLEEPVLEV